MAVRPAWSRQDHGRREIFSQLTRAGIETGYVDIDQLGMCYPEAASDPGLHRMKAQNLGSVVANFRAAGARCVIVSGVVDAAHGVHADMIPQAAVTVCRLRASRDELRQRFAGRRGQIDAMDQRPPEQTRQTYTITALARVSWLS